jgi:hypothetical protein
MTITQSIRKNGCVGTYGTIAAIPAETFPTYKRGKCKKTHEQHVHKPVSITIFEQKPTNQDIKEKVKATTENKSKRARVDNNIKDCVPASGTLGWLVLED